MSKLTEIRAAIESKLALQVVQAQVDVHRGDQIDLLNILLDMVCELERIERAAQVGALSAFGAPEASKSLPGATGAQGGLSQ